MRLSELSVRFGRELKLGVEELRALNIAGALHDIGKVIVPDAILLKAGPLDATEWAIMRQHPEVGERICKLLRSIHLGLPIVCHHHEKQDGSGYPDGLSGRDIPSLASVMQLVDVYCLDYGPALSERPKLIQSPEAYERRSQQGLVA